MKLITKRHLTMFCVVFAVLFSTNSTFAQTTSFTYQGKLTDGGNPANGSYDLQFALFDSLSGGTQIGSALTRSGTAVTGGVFVVQLDFGANAFPGTNRFLETSVRPAGVGTFTLLSPRQQVTSTPYAIRSAVSTNADSAANATQLGGVAAGQYVLTTDARMTDPRPPTPGSGNYIQNAASQQTNSNFNISGNGVVNGRIGIGTNVPLSKLDVRGNLTIGSPAFAPIFGANALFVANDDGGDPNNYFRMDGSLDTLYIVASSQPGASRGARIILRTGQAGTTEADRITIDEVGNVAVSGLLLVGNLSGSGGSPVCQLFNILTSCSSSLRYKTAIRPFHSGLTLLRNLQPVSFQWKSDGSSDLGLIAEEVAALEPRLVTHNQKGEIEGIKYDHLTAVLINAFKEQQAMIDSQQQQIATQQSMIKSLEQRLAALEKNKRRKGK